MRWVIFAFIFMVLVLYAYGPGANLVATNITSKLSVVHDATGYKIVGLPDVAYDKICLGSNEDRLFHTNQEVICSGCVEGWKNNRILFTGWKENVLFLAAFRGSEYEIFPVRLNEKQVSEITTSYSRAFKFQHLFCSDYDLRQQLVCQEWRGKCLLTFEE